MKRCACGLALLAVACMAPPRADPIPAALLCSDALASTVAEIDDPKACTAAIRKRLARIQRTALERWLAPGEWRPLSMVQVQFSFDAEGRPRSACVLGGTGASEAREALAALAAFEPRTPLRRRERCALGQPLVITFGAEPVP